MSICHRCSGAGVICDECGMGIDSVPQLHVNEYSDLCEKCYEEYLTKKAEDIING